AITPAGASVATVPYRKMFRSRVGTIDQESSIHHRAAINEVYIALKYKAGAADPRLMRWRTPTVPIVPNGKLIPDAVAETEHAGANHGYFVEVDLGTETRRIWQRKTQAYLELARTGAFKRVLPVETFRVMVITTSNRRL